MYIRALNTGYRFSKVIGKEIADEVVNNNPTIVDLLFRDSPALHVDAQDVLFSILQNSIEAQLWAPEMIGERTIRDNGCTSAQEALQKIELLQKKPVTQSQGYFNGVAMAQNGGFVVPIEAFNKDLLVVVPTQKLVTLFEANTTYMGGLF
jgi:hypothetical protein